ncbi:hypothetical protein LVD15_07755 [Fulvivirga maritima]|uniref:hypothetical protein n=1 Tax=Fulvivirga maritima TaxID=2904247 RepID=UPI001F3E2420|nr:hypothetical protein [Fulvivirga maritima]UII28312.1 hypothetical protein LVD15_07755 [Fulvivirga maritima]
MNFKALLSLPAKRPIDILKQAYEWVNEEKNKENPQPPFLVIRTATHYLEGWLLNYHESDGVVLLGVMEGPKVDLKYLYVEAIESLELPRAQRWLFNLSDGENEEFLQESSVPTKLQISAHSKKVSEELTHLLGNEVAIKIETQGEFADAAMKPVMRMLWIGIVDKIRAVIEKISEEAMGKEALQESVKEILLIGGDENGIDLEAGTLKVKLDMRKAAKDIWSNDYMQEKIEEKL